MSEVRRLPRSIIQPRRDESAFDPVAAVDRIMGVETKRPTPSPYPGARSGSGRPLHQASSTNVKAIVDRIRDPNFEMSEDAREIERRRSGNA